MKKGYEALKQARQLVENLVKNDWDISEVGNMQYVLKKGRVVLEANLSYTPYIQNATISNFILAGLV